MTSPTRPIALAAFLIMLSLGAATAQGSFNTVHAYEADFPFVPGFGDGETTIVSGAGTVTGTGRDTSLGLLDITGLTLEGLEEVCWSHAEGTECTRDEATLHMTGSIGLWTPEGLEASLTASHLLGYFHDAGGEEIADGIRMDQAFVATTVKGTANVDVGGTGEQWGISGLDDDTVVELRSGGTPVTRLGDGEAFLATGHVSFTTAVEGAALPFAPGSSAALRPAAADAAREGLDLDRIAHLMDRLHDRPSRAVTTDIDLAALAAVLGGSILQVPGGTEGNATSASVDELLLVRYERLDLASGTGTVQATAAAPLVLEEGQVRGASPLVGVGYMAVPMWSIALWVVGLGLFAARLVVKPPKEVERYKGLRWIGLALAPVAFLLVAWLWDREVRAVLGVSVFSGSSGMDLGMLALIEFGLLSVILFATAAPLRLILRNGLLLGRQGSFMGLASPVAMVLGFFLGVTLLPSYLEHLLLAALGQAT